MLSQPEFSTLMVHRNKERVTHALSNFNVLFSLMDEFDEKIRVGDFGPMATYWQTYLDMVQILLDYIKSIRLPDWDLHLQSTERMLIWIHAYDRTNYSRHFTYTIGLLSRNCRLGIQQFIKNSVKVISLLGEPKGSSTCYHHTR